MEAIDSCDDKNTVVSAASLKETNFDRQGEKFDIMKYMPKSVSISSITKYITCQLINRVTSNFQKYSNLLPSTLIKYEPLIKHNFERLKIANSASKKNSLIKDYNKVLSKLTKCYPLHYVMNIILNEVNDEFIRKEYGKIKKTSEYAVAIDTLCKASNDSIYNCVLHN